MLRRINRVDVRPIVPVARRRRRVLTGEKDPMFTGLVAETGRILDFSPDEAAWRLLIRTNEVAARCRVGDSVSVNGVCLTVASISGRSLRFDLLEETRQRTNFQAAESGRLVNLELSLSVGSRLGGHFVSGHVDTVGTAAVFEKRGADQYLRVACPPEFLRYIVPKGSIAIDGISLTVADVDAAGFGVWLIPHTLEVTHLRELTAGALLNLEFDLLAKYAEKLLFSPAPETETVSPFPLPPEAVRPATPPT